MYITNFEISYVNRIADSLRASSPIWASEASLAKTRERAAKPRGPSLVLSRLASLAQIGELARRLNSGYREGWGVGDWREGP